MLTVVTVSLSTLRKVVGYKLLSVTHVSCCRLTFEVILCRSVCVYGTNRTRWPLWLGETVERFRFRSAVSWHWFRRRTATCWSAVSSHFVKSVLSIDTSTANTVYWTTERASGLYKYRRLQKAFKAIVKFRLDLLDHWHNIDVAYV